MQNGVIRSDLCNHIGGDEFSGRRATSTSRLSPYGLDRSGNALWELPKMWGKSRQVSWKTEPTKSIPVQMQLFHSRAAGFYLNVEKVRVEKKSTVDPETFRVSLGMIIKVIQGLRTMRICEIYLARDRPRLIKKRLRLGLVRQTSA